MSIRQALLTVPFLARASPAALARLCEQARPCHYDRGDFLFHAGESAQRMYVAQTGRVAATLISPHGTQLLFHVAGPGEAPGHVDILDGGPYSSSAQALSTVTAVVVPGRACVELLENEPAVALQFARELVAIIRILDASMADLVFLDLEQRLARTLVAAPAVDGVVSMLMTQGELAARLGVARQSLNQAMGRLAARGWIRVDSPRRITIVDGPALAAFVTGDALGLDRNRGARGHPG